MKSSIIPLVFILLFTLSCKEQATKSNTEKIEETEMLSEAGLTDEEAPVLLGVQNRDTLEAEPYNEWFMNSYKDHSLDSTSLAIVKAGLKDVRLTIFMGTWCEDSQREVPAMYKILDEIGYESPNVKLITMSEEKTTPKGLEKGKEITNIPTFLFLKDGKELGRIVEYPLESLEKDMAKILTGKEYKHAYAID